MLWQRNSQGMSRHSLISDEKVDNYLLYYAITYYLTETKILNSAGSKFNKKIYLMYNIAKELNEANDML